MSISPRSNSSATTEDIADYELYIINGTPYFIETPRDIYFPPERLVVWNENEEQIGTVRDLQGTEYQHVYSWVYRNLARIYGNIREIPVSPAAIPSTPQQQAQQEFADMQSPASSPLRLNFEDAVMESPIRQPNLDELSVTFNELTASCMYYYDGSSFMPTQPYVPYQVSLLTCATPTGFFPIRQLSAEHDFHIDISSSSLMLNPANIRGTAFALTKDSPDVNKRVVIAVPPSHISIPVNHSSFSNLICLYIPPGSSSPAMTYRTDIVLNPLRIGVNCSQIPHPNFQGNPNFSVTRIDPHAMTVECLETLDNVHITGNLQLQQCPSERLIAARVATPEVLVTPLRGLVDNLNSRLPTSEFDLFRLPYVYEINVQTNTCTKTPINAAEIMKVNTETGMSYLSQELYDEHIAPHESLLIRNMLFQMMFVYEKRGPEFKANCPPHKMLFDFYLRRDSRQVVFHYDRTAFFEVSTLSLLFIMPDHVTRPGPHIIPMPTQIDPTVSGGMRYLDPETRRGDRLTRVCTFQVQNGTCVMCNNTFTSHSTPGTTQLFERGVKPVSWLKFNAQDPDDPANAKLFHFPEMHIPEEYKARMEATKRIQRSFIRMWHVVSDPVRDSTGIFGHPQIMFSHEVFDGMVNDALELQGLWLRGAGCICLELTDYHSPTEMSDKVHGTVRGAFGGRHASSSFKTKSAKLAKLAKSASFSLKAKEMHSKNQFRASTMSSVIEKIKRKLMQFEKIYKDANQNVLMIRGKHKAAHGGTRRAGGLLSKRRHTRKARFNKK
jgi:hypothetical protein